MSEKKHLDILSQGVDAWNDWREREFYVRPNLREANLSNVELRGAYLGGADLSSVDLSFSNLSGAQLENADLTGAKFSGADLSRSNLVHAALYLTDLVGANLSGADMQACDLRDADLADATLRGTELSGVIFNGCNLSKADLTNAKLNGTTFGDNDLREVVGLETVTHLGPSIIGLHTLYRSEGKIPENFLRGCGVPESLIVQIPALVAVVQPIQFYSCFISYSSKDEDLAQRLHADLQSRGVRCWFAPEALGIGDRFRERVDEAIRLYDKLLVVLSRHSIYSQWVEVEVKTALEREMALGSQVLFPIRIDAGAMEGNESWLKLLRSTRQIGDFTGWRDYERYQRAFSRLLRDLTLGGTELLRDTGEAL
jgi:hypothetical protein